MLQLLNPEGELIENSEFPLNLATNQIKSMYRDMAIVRGIDREATALQRQGELGLWASSLGQEAAQIGSGTALNSDDFIFPTYREHGVALTRGIEPVQMLALYRGVTNGGWDPIEKKFAPYCLVIGNQVLHAVGYAMGCALDKSDQATIVYFGDGATAQGDVNEGFIFASVFNAPVVFFCQNNQWAISQPTSRQTKIDIYRRADGFGFPGLKVDGNDVFACYAATEYALKRARSGSGPTLIEAFTYRMGAHTTSDDPSRYRSAKEYEEWKSRDPIARLKLYLEKNNLANTVFFEGIDAEVSELAADLRQLVRNLEPVEFHDLFDQVYDSPHSTLTSQRNDFIAYEDSLAEESK